MENGDRYSGTVNEEGLVDGAGRYEYEDSKAVYEGTFNKGKKEGEGQLTWQTQNSRTKTTTDWSFKGQM